jgi:fused signal recognition particle receptor
MKWSLKKLFKSKPETDQPATDAPPAQDMVQTEEAAPAAEAAAEGKPGWLGRFRRGFRKTHDRLARGLKAVLTAGRKLDDETIEEIEEILYTADMGHAAVARLCEHLRAAYREGRIEETGQVREFLKKEIRDDLAGWDLSLALAESGPTVYIVAGVNGSGKTTSIAKLAHMFRAQGRSVLLAASDTFRAAAGEQLQIWAERVGAEIIRNESADPAAVAYDAAERAVARSFDVLIVDTAGRLHTRTNLMQELQKIRRVLANKIPGAPHEVLMVLDATTGQNAVSQAVKFNEAINLTGIILAKLDGTAKGGVVFGMREKIDIPVKFVGVGETMQDIAPFDPEQFVEALFD